MPYTRRHERLNRLILEFMADIFHRELPRWTENLPQGSLIFPTEARLNEKKTVVTIFVAVWGIPEPERVVDFLNQTQKYWRKLLAERLGPYMRRMPELRFVYDQSEERAQRIHQILQSLGFSAHEPPPQE